MKAVYFLAIGPPSARQERQLNGHRNFTGLLSLEERAVVRWPEVLEHISHSHAPFVMDAFC